jgi:hypothetical protein
MKYRELLFQGRAVRSGLALLGAMVLVACGDDVTPVPLTQSLLVREGASLGITLAAEGGSPQFTVVEGPEHGTLTGTGRDLVYVPDAHFLGRDSFTFTASSDGELGTIHIEVTHTPYYAITRGSEDLTSKLYFMERGVAELVGDTGHALVAIKVDPTDGTLYGATRRNDFVGDSSCDSCLVTLDTTTGAVTVVGPFDHDGNPATTEGPVSSLAFTSDGQLFGWTEYADDAVSIAKETGAVTVLGESGISWTWGSGMWTDLEDTLWFINGDGNVFVIDPDNGQALQMHAGQEICESAEITCNELQIRGDFNPATGTYWGVGPGYGYIPASATARLFVNSAVAELLQPAGVEAVTAIHNLAFVR